MASEADLSLAIFQQATHLGYTWVTHLSLAIFQLGCKHLAIHLTITNLSLAIFQPSRGLLLRSKSVNLSLAIFQPWVRCSRRG